MRFSLLRPGRTGTSGAAGDGMDILRMDKLQLRGEGFMSDTKLFLDEFTWPEVDAETSKSDVAYLPLGTQESHGRILPMGTDTYIAAGASILASRKTGGIVLHPLHYGFSGATNVFKGTVSIPMHLHMQVVKAVLKNLWGQGFRTLMLVNAHNGNIPPATMAIRELFEYENVVGALFNPLEIIDKEKYGVDSAGAENAICFAALKVLGKEHLLPDTASLRNGEKPPLRLPSFRGLQTGYHFTHMDQHQPERKVDMQAAVKMLEEAAGILAEKVFDLKEYTNHISSREQTRHRI